MNHRSRPLSVLIYLLSVAALMVSPLAASSQSGLAARWQSIGPYGGDVRAFASVPGEPQHLYLGDEDNWIFESLDAGTNWIRLSRIDPTDDLGGLIVDSILVDSSDSKTLFAGLWRSFKSDGGLYVSHDSGKTWKPVPALKGQSVRSLAQAPSDAKILVVGTLEAIFRSQDHGDTWERISPPAADPLSREIHEVESLAIDPRKPDTIYAGTWHLPWKTTDGGAHWHNIKQGVIDDSDVFSIILDPERPSIVYASACSGIYKSENSGELFHKIQGIPATARRTRVLMQDTHHREVVYAGTTEGLYRTRDGGRQWQLITGSDVIINDIWLDPEHDGHILLGTDRSGVLASSDSGTTFAQSNQGFSARKVEALVADMHDPRRILAGVVNDKSYGGVFLTTDGGGSWSQLSEGLAGRDVFTLAQAKDGTILAGTNHGIFALETSSSNPGGAAATDTPHWTMRSSIVNYGTRIVNETVKGRRVSRLEKVTIPARALSSRVADFDLSGDTWVVATAEGVFTSKDQGTTWQGGLVLGSAEYRSVASYDGEILAARREGAAYSKDGGATWDAVRLPSKVKDIRKIAFSKEGELWVGAGDGVYFSRDFSKNGGNTWFWLEKVPVRDIGDLAFDQKTGRMLVSSRSSQVLYSVDPANLSFTGTSTGFRLFLAREAGGVRFAASLQDGVLTEAQQLPKPDSKPTAPVASKKSEEGPEAAVHPALPRH